MTKVFGIGFHKTGTTSLGEALDLLGYSNVHAARPLRQKLGQEAMMKCLTSDDLEPIWQVADDYDSFQDNPWQMLYRQADERFPGSKFILTIRESDSWFKSVYSQFSGRQSAFRSWIYGPRYADPKGNKKHYISRYERHNQEVKSYFSERPNDLLVLNITNGDGWNKLCPFLKLPVPDKPFPYANKREVSTLFARITRKLQSLRSHE